MTYEYIIDNILDLIKAATSSQTVDVESVVEHCHPLGRLDASTMKTILAYENLGDDFHALYRTVLVDTPVGRYFTQFLAEVADERAAADAGAVRATFAEIPMTVIENSVKKFYLEDFAAFVACVPLGRRGGGGGGRRGSRGTGLRGESTTTWVVGRRRSGAVSPPASGLAAAPYAG